LAISAAVWGTRLRGFGIVVSSQGLGLVLLVALALLWREPVPPASDLLIGAVAGVAGVIGLMALYSALGAGHMGLAAPLIGVLAAIIPVLFSISQEGAPGAFQIAGFGAALLGVWLISGAGGEAKTRLSGLGRVWRELASGLFIRLTAAEEACCRWRGGCPTPS
jgi:hypothetical protein